MDTRSKTAYTESMVKKTTKSSAKKATTTKKVVKKSPVRKARTNKVDYYPNRMTLAVSVLGGVSLVLLALIAVLGLK